MTFSEKANEVQVTMPVHPCMAPATKMNALLTMATTTSKRGRRRWWRWLLLLMLGQTAVLEKEPKIWRKPAVVFHASGS